MDYIKASCYNEIRNLHKRVFTGKEERIPLIVSPPDPPSSPYPRQERFVTDTEKAVDEAVASQMPKSEVGSDYLPVIDCVWYQNILLPSLYGAKVSYTRGIIPIPIPEQCFRNTAEAVEVGIPKLEGKLVDEMIDRLGRIVRRLPEGVSFCTQVVSSPFDLALTMIGDEFLVGLMNEPQASRLLLDNLTTLSLQAVKLVKKAIGQPMDEFITSRGICYPGGLRLPIDSVVNLSPDLLRQYAVPVLGRFRHEFGRLCAHYCTAPALSAHVLPALLGTGCVDAVDNWQGPAAYWNAHGSAPTQNEIAIITDYDLGTPEKMDTFLDLPAVRDVPRRGGRGLFINTTAASVDEGKRIYGQWRERLSSRGISL